MSFLRCRPSCSPRQGLLLISEAGQSVNPRDPSVGPSPALGLQVCAITPDFCTHVLGICSAD